MQISANCAHTLCSFFLYSFVHSFSEWLTHQHRDTLASIVGHPTLTSYLAIADGEATGRMRFEMTEVLCSDILCLPHKLTDGHRECFSLAGLLPRRMTIKMTAILFCVPETGSVLSVVATPPMSKLVDSYTQSALNWFTVELESDSTLFAFPVCRHRPSTDNSPRGLASPFAAGHFVRSLPDTCHNSASSPRHFAFVMQSGGVLL